MRTGTGGIRALGMLVSTVACLIVLPGELRAQAEALTALLARITAINAYATFAKLHPKPAAVATHRPGTDKRWKDGLSGYGVEFLFTAKTFRDPVPEDQAVPDTTRKLTSIVVKRDSAGLKRDTTYTMETTVAPKGQGRETSIVEVALGYSQVSGFFSTDVTFDLRGSIRELPSLAFYWSNSTLSLSPYVGIRSGLVQLHQARIHDTTRFAGTDSAAATVYPIDAAQSFQAGPVFGFSPGWKDVTLFVEVAYMHRNFPSLSVTPKDGAVPARFPRSLNFSGFYYQFGLQVDIGAPKK